VNGLTAGSVPNPTQLTDLDNDLTAATGTIDTATTNAVAGINIVTALADTQAPVIVILGANPLTVVHSSAFSNPGSVVTDNVDVGLVATITGTVNISIVGTYTLAYSATDTAGNSVTRNLTVNVTDQTAPVITLIGANPQTTAQGSAYTELGATVSDNVDVGLAATIDSSAVLTGIVGSYTVTYNVSDGAGNPAIQLTRTVNVTDQTAPVITLAGANPQIITLGSAYTELGATVTDNVDVGLAATINSSTVDTNTLGSYTVTYNVSDGAGNSAIQKSRTVNVVVPSATPAVWDQTNWDQSDWQ